MGRERKSEPDFSGADVRNWQREQRELKEPAASPVRMVLATAAVVAALPFAAPFYAIESLLQGVRIVYTRLRGSVATYADDASLDFEAASQISLIPILGLYVSVGTGFAFLQISNDDSILGPGATTLLAVCAVTLAVIVQATRGLAQHRRGLNVMVFEPDVDPIKGVAKLRELRQSGAPGFLPGRAAVAAKAAKDALARDLEPEDVPSFRVVLSELARRSVDVTQLAVVILASGAWVGIANAWWGPLTLWRVMLYAVLTVILIIVAATLRAKSFYFDYLRWGKREWRLLERAINERPAEKADGVDQQGLAAVHRELTSIRDSIEDLAGLAGRVASLQSSIDRLESRLSQYPPHRHRKFWRRAFGGRDNLSPGAAPKRVC